METTNLHRLARLGELAALRNAVESGIDVNSKDSFGATALHYAIAEKQAHSIDLLLKLGADVAIQDADGYSALHYAIEYNMPSVVESLLKRCPTAVSISNRHGNQPLWTAAFNARGNYEMVSMLLQCGADPKHLNNVNLSPIDIAKKKNDSEMIKLFERDIHL